MIRLLRGVLGIVWVVDFTAYVAVAFVIGGDAINGKMDHGHYFLASHGKLTEVSQAVFTYSQWHTWILWLNTALFLALNLPFVLIEWRKRYPARSRA